MWANLFFDWKKCQFLFGISAINVVCGLNVVTRVCCASGGVDEPKSSVGMGKCW